MKLGDEAAGSPGGSMHGQQQLLGALAPPDSPSPRKSVDDAPLNLGETPQAALRWG